ncbi:MAG: flavodoxin family protein [Lachnospiraceae bacterium]
MENKVRALLPDDNEYFGSFFCQGKMPIRVRENTKLCSAPSMTSWPAGSSKFR